MNSYRQIQCRPTPRIYVTGRYFIPELRAASRLAAGVASGEYSLVTVDGGDFADAAEQSAAFVLGSYYPNAVPVPAPGANAGQAVGIASGLYAQVIVPVPGGSLQESADQAAAITAGAYAQIVIPGGSYPQPASVSAGVIAGEYSAV